MTITIYYDLIKAFHYMNINLSKIEKFLILCGKKSSFYKLQLILSIIYNGDVSVSI